MNKYKLLLTAAMMGVSGTAHSASHPFSPLNPMGPMSPLSPVNPIKSNSDSSISNEDIEIPKPLAVGLTLLGLGFSGALLGKMGFDQVREEIRDRRDRKKDQTPDNSRGPT